MNVERYEAACGLLWDKTQTDWELNINTVMTEPVAPIASITAEKGAFPKFSAFGDTVDEAIDNVVNAVFEHFA